MHYPPYDAAVHGMAHSALHACHTAPESSPVPVKDRKLAKLNMQRKAKCAHYK